MPILSRLLGAFCLFASLLHPVLAQTPPPGAIVVADVAEPLTLDPQKATTPAEFRILSGLFEGLVRFRKGSMEVEPSLAESWTVSPDGRVYRFKLRSGIAFTDGSPLDASAVAFTFGRMLDPNHPFAATGPFPLAFLFSPVDSVAAIDAGTVEFRLRDAYAPFLANLASPTGVILSPASVKIHGSDVGRHPTGTGPFRLSGWTAEGGVELVRNEVFHGAPPLARTIVFQAMPDDAERLAAVKSGRVDVAMEAGREALPDLRKAAGTTLAETVAPHLWFLILDTREGTFSDKRVRQAVNYAIDKQAIVEDVLHGGAAVAAGPIPSAFGSASLGGVEPYPHDPARARELIRAAGAEGKSVTFFVAQNGAGMLDPVAMAERIGKDLREVGLRPDVQTYEWNTFLSNVNPGLEGKADMAEMAWTVLDPDTLPFLALGSRAVPREGGFNAGYYANPEVDRRLAEARAATDPATRARLYGEVQRIVHDDAPWAFVAEAKTNAVAAPGVSGLALEPTSVIDLSGLSKP